MIDETRRWHWPTKAKSRVRRLLSSLIYHLSSLNAASALALATIVAYLPALRGDFIWDDDSHVTKNVTLRSLDGLRRIWFELGAVPQYYPLVHTSFWVEYHLWGLNPRGYHLVNVLLHALNAVLAWRILRRLRVPGAWLAAAVFALHPVHVESVAWITERKNVLSAAFYLAATLAFFRFIPPGREAGSHTGGRGACVLAAGLFVCALLSKTVTASWPAAMFLVLWWKKGRVHGLAARVLAPLLVVGAAMGLLTAWLERTHVGAEGEEWSLSIAQRCLIAGQALWFYAGKLVWPANLTFIYPRWRFDGGLGPSLPLLAAGVVIVALWAWRQRIGRGPLAAVLYFAGTLTPALGFFDVYPFRFSFVADHFQYLASLGLIALGAGVAATLAARFKAPGTYVAPLGAAAVLTGLGLLTWRQGRHYESAETLWRDTLAKNPACWMAHINLADVLSRRGEHREALGHLREAVHLKPDNAKAHNNLGVSLDRLGDSAEAIAHYRQALDIDSKYVSAWINLGNALSKRNDLGLAVAAYQQAVRIRPDLPAAQFSLGQALAKAERTREAVERFRGAVRLDSRFVAAWLGLGAALAELGELESAVEALRIACQLDPQLVVGRYNLGLLLARQGRTQEAVAAFREVLRIEPAHALARSQLEALLHDDSRKKPPP